MNTTNRRLYTQNKSSRLAHTPDGTLYRKYYNFSLECSKVAFFSTSWTVVHPITDQSPLPDDLKRSDTELLVALPALDDTFVQRVHTHFSYRYEEIRWGHKFRPLFDGSQQQGTVVLDLDRLDDTDEVELN